MKNKLKTIITIIIIVLGGAVLLYASSDVPYGQENLMFRGKSTKAEVVSDYIQGIKENNVKQINKLIPRNYDAESAIQGKISGWSNVSLNNIKIEYQGSMWPHYQHVLIKNNDFEDIIALKKINNKWYLIMGKPDNPVPEGLELKID